MVTAPPVERPSLDLVRLLDAADETVVVHRLDAAPPTADGLLFSGSVVVPDWIRCVYYAPFQRHAINPELDLWPEGYNQCHPLPVRDLRDLKRGGLFTLFELAAGGYLALLPLVGFRSAAWLRGDGEGLRLDAGTFGNAPAFTGELPLLAVVRDADPHAACARVWALALRHPALAGVGRLRHDKVFPEVFDYLGWCSFEEFKLDIDERVITGALRDLTKSDVPVRWALVDDGHIDDGSAADAAALQTQEGAVGQVDDALKARRLHTVYPHPEKFPRGWAPVVEAAKGEGSRLKWLGLWLNFNGYWGGIARRHRLGEAIDAHLVDVANGAKLPGENAADGEAFFEEFTRPAREAGFSFLKVDNQAGNLRKYAGRVGNAVTAAAGCKQGLDLAVDRHFDALISCMAHNNLCAFHQPHSQVMRCSEDYKKEDEWRARHHLHNSFGNMLWLGQTVWGDHDMFHSSDRVVGPLMARSKAISGGPIYLSDAPDHFVADLIRPLCFADGRILRPLAPAVPLAESLFIDPYEDDDAYRVIAPLPHGCAAAAAYNLTFPGKPVRGAWRAEDLRQATALLSAAEADAWRRDGDGDRVVFYDCIGGRSGLLSEPQDFTLAPLTDAFVVLSPVRSGWALIGNPEKYLPPAFVTRFDVHPRRLVVSTYEAGPVLIWHTPGERLISTSPIENIAEGLWRLTMPSGDSPIEIAVASDRNRLNSDAQASANSYPQ